MGRLRWNPGDGWTELENSREGESHRQGEASNYSSPSEFPGGPAYGSKELRSTLQGPIVQVRSAYQSNRWITWTIPAIQWKGPWRGKKKKTEFPTIPGVLKSNTLTIRNCSSVSFMCIISTSPSCRVPLLFYLEILISLGSVFKLDIFPITGFFHGHYRPVSALVDISRERSSELLSGTWGWDGVSWVPRHEQ